VGALVLVGVVTGLVDRPAKSEVIRVQRDLNHRQGHAPVQWLVDEAGLVSRVYIGWEAICYASCEVQQRSSGTNQIEGAFSNDVLLAEEQPIMSPFARERLAREYRHTDNVVFFSDFFANRNKFIFDIVTDAFEDKCINPDEERRAVSNIRYAYADRVFEPFFAEDRGLVNWKSLDLYPSSIAGDEGLLGNFCRSESSFRAALSVSKLSEGNFLEPPRSLVQIASLYGQDIGKQYKQDVSQLPI
jgi:hypothetical protein